MGAFNNVRFVVKSFFGSDLFSDSVEPFHLAVSKLLLKSEKRILFQQINASILFNINTTFI